MTKVIFLRVHIREVEVMYKHRFLFKIMVSLDRIMTSLDWKMAVAVMQTPETLNDYVLYCFIKYAVIYKLYQFGSYNFCSIVFGKNTRKNNCLTKVQTTMLALISFELDKHD